MVTGLDKEKIIHIFFHPIDVGTEDMDCGVAGSFKALSATISPVPRCWKNNKELSSIIIHELGHLFNLQHTHSEDDSLEEFVDRSNCKISADKLCDTLADPNLLGNVTANCTYVGDDVDAHGDKFNVSSLIPNYMSYALGSCQNNFSQEQNDLISQAAEALICKR